MKYITDSLRKSIYISTLEVHVTVSKTHTIISVFSLTYKLLNNKKIEVHVVLVN